MPAEASRKFRPPGPVVRGGCDTPYINVGSTLCPLYDLNHSHL